MSDCEIDYLWAILRRPPLIPVVHKVGTINGYDVRYLNMKTYSIRSTTEDDIESVMAMYDHSRALMRANGNEIQWVGYPTRTQLLSDMQYGVSFVIDDTEHRPAGTFALVSGKEPTYDIIVHGRWIDTTTPYATIHRLAKLPGFHDIAESAFTFAKECYPHLRIDTHESNRTLRHLADKEGFVECGIVYMNDKTERIAYEWWRWDGVTTDLQKWVESEILPHYDTFDAAHRHDHARRVIARAMTIGLSLKKEHTCSDAMVYTAAAMHDLGLCEGRAEHHLASGRIIRSCHELRQWFSADEVEQIAQAAEDHRASAGHPPRSLLGCIVAEADRDVEPERIVRRTIEYGLANYPEMGREGHWQRMLQHLNEKYAESGYIKLWLPDSPNAAPLTELRDLIHNEAQLRTLFNSYFHPDAKYN